MPSKINELFIKDHDDFRNPTTREVLEILTKRGVLKRKEGNKFGQGAKYKMDDPNKIPEIVKYESDWFNL